VEYLYYILLILALLAGCLFALKIPGRRRLAHNPEELAERAARRRQRDQKKASATAAELAHRHAILKRELTNVRTPWGWPGSEHQGGRDQNSKHHLGEIASHGVLRRWIDHLVAEKQLVQDEYYRQHREDSLRALLEDRYGRVLKPTEMTYRKVRPPLLRDPSLPHDQMDNFPSGRADQIVASLDKQPGKPDAERVTPLRKTGSLKEIRTPWGW
jgi:hypothetical protein